MKHKLVFAVLVVAAVCVSLLYADDNKPLPPTIAEHFSVSSLTEVIVLEFETMDTSGPAKKAKIISSEDALAKILECLQAVQSDGNEYKDLGRQTPTSRVYFLHDKNQVFDLTIYGRSISAPAPKNGSFGLKPYEKEKILVSLLLGKKA